MPQRQDDRFVWNDEQPEMVLVESFEKVGEYRIRMRFTDGQEREIDLMPFLHGPVFEPLLANRRLFDTIHIEGGTIAWDNGADIAPETLNEDSQPARSKRTRKMEKEKRFSPQRSSR